ncbi:RagB/SusD family nutrient uptake outer membrane protein [Sphingobacterium sp. ML3W]|uniref:RagB/SusD family nutrient uptake outer membrane protein n=1 Tax=Sphingobacterium sp. ML3W TaxID=1538644 RepID=UPI00249BF1C9|nr:RagB/SusD family nutrient uptake outer membrane protein [Sphingobacterium sp. ML3W]WFA80872.1 RagB/SusD family nutrient uptake outer membrane protein [Sphingobacterium sp. ML3W]
MKTLYFSIGIFALVILSACNKFLEEKPDIKMVIPKSLDDAELLLNDYSTMNIGYPAIGEWGTDEYYVSAETFDGMMTVDQRNAYIWKDEPYFDVTQWQGSFKTVFNANQVLEIINKVEGTASNEKARHLSGIAHFFRAFAFQQLAEVFAPPYDGATASTEMGIPMRLDPGIDKPSERASLKQSYEQIITDYKLAVALLPPKESIPGRPSRAAAYAGLARAYLYMAEYEKAYLYADSSLKLHAELLDFNNLNVTAELPFERFNTEVLFSAISNNAGPMSLNNGLIDSNLYDSYNDNDLRKLLFFRSNSYPKDSYSFKGNYDQSIATLFVGLTTSEVYLIKAECAVRIGKVSEALDALNSLLKNRFNKNRFTAVTETDANVLLSNILLERQKELLFRGRRWSDLKRLNLDPRFRKTIQRNIQGQTYSLSPDSRKYAFRLPEPAVVIGNIPQNIR